MNSLQKIVDSEVLGRVSKRQAAILELLSDGKIHDSSLMCSQVELSLGHSCWGTRPRRNLSREIGRLREKGFRIGYSRMKGLTGYYFMDPPLLSMQQKRSPEPINWRYVEMVRNKSAVEKMKIVFSAIEFALTQKILVLREDHPDWPENKIGIIAREQVFGIKL